jgi:DNA-binding NarL/FixJ family response regulator
MGLKKSSRKSTAKKRLCILIADDETLFRDVIKDVLSCEKDVEIVAEAADGPEAVQLAKSHKPDVVLMDIHLPIMDGIAATRAIRAACPNTKVLMLSGFQDDAHVMESVQAGAYGYLSKKLPTAELVKALKTFAEQGTMLPPPVMQRVISRITQRGYETPLGTATKTQMRVLSLLGEGKSNKEIAAELGCNVKTVKNHLNSLFQKFDVKNRTEAVVKGLKAGLISGRESSR